MVESNWKVFVKNEFQTVYPFCVRAFFSNVWYTNNLRQRISFLSHKIKRSRQTKNRRQNRKPECSTKMSSSIKGYRECLRLSALRKHAGHKKRYSGKCNLFWKDWCLFDPKKMFLGKKYTKCGKEFRKWYNSILFQHRGEAALSSNCLNGEPDNRFTEQKWL